jgi:two-component system chemotaxis response regulator CheB
MSPEGPSVLASLLARAGRLPAVVPHQREAIRPGRIYVARPDHHLLVRDGDVLSVRGPRENRHRPAVDPLFRSAALAYASRVVAVVLTGALDDGTAGLLAVKKQGGIGVAQEPAEALFSGMPGSAIAAGVVDHVLPLAEIPPLLVRLAGEPAPAAPSPSDILRREVDMDLGAPEDIEATGKPSPFSCPECHGVLWEAKDPDLLRFRCRVGHAYTAQSLVAEQDQAQEDALWAAMRSLEESASLSDRMSRSLGDRKHAALAGRLAERARVARQHAAELRKLLTVAEAPKMSETVDG